MNGLEYLINYRVDFRRLPWVVVGTLLVLGAALYPWRTERHGSQRGLRVTAVPVAVANYIAALAYSADESAIQSGWCRVLGRVAASSVVLGIGVLAGI